MKTKSYSIKFKILCVIAIIIQYNLSYAQVQYSGTVNTGTTASAINFQTQATGTYSFATGYQSTAIGNTSTALGYLSIANGNYSTAFGYRSTAFGQRSVAIGESCYSNDQGYSFGQGAKANVSQSLAIGRFVETNASGSIALGSSISGNSLINGINNSLMVGFNSTIPTLFVGPSPTFSSFGNVGIGTTSPLQPLHINGNLLLTGLSSTLLFADSPPTNGSWGKMAIEYDADGIGNKGLNFWKPFEAGKVSTSTYDPKGGALNYILFLKDDGNVGIGTNAPKAKLHVTGTAKITQNFTVGDIERAASMNVYGPASITQNFTVGTESTPASMNIYGPSNLVGTLRVSSLQSEKSSMIVSDKEGNLGVAPIPIGDQMGSHIATQNLQMSGHFITNDDRTSTNEGIYISPSGSVGIKTNSIPTDDDFIVSAPASKAQSYLRVANSDAAKPALFWATSGSESLGIGVSGGKCQLIENGPGVSNQTVMIIQQGKVGIGPLSGISFTSGTIEHYLFVAGGITTEEVQVKLKTTPWSDYVFSEKYDLKPLSEVERFIKQNKHLSEVPNDAEVNKNGIELGSMNAILLKKIEELTLYIIEQDKRIKILEQRN